MTPGDSDGAALARRLCEHDLTAAPAVLNLVENRTPAGREQTEACTRAAFETGITFFDTANVYGRGAAESAWGEILSSRSRDSYVLATKVFMPMSDDPEDRGLSSVKIAKQIDASLHIAKFAFHQNHVALVHLAFAQCCMKKNQRRAFFGDQQHARCIAIEAVHQFEELGLGPRRPKSLDQSERDTAAAVNRQSRWLVECDQYLVLENDVKRGKLGSASLDYGLRRRTYRRDAQFIAHRQSHVGSDSLAVEAHFPAAQNAINVALGNAFQARDEVVVDALAGFFLGHLDPAHRGSADAPGNVFLAIGRHAGILLSS